MYNEIIKKGAGLGDFKTVFPMLKSVIANLKDVKVNQNIVSFCPSTVSHFQLEHLSSVN